MKAYITFLLAVIVLQSNAQGYKFTIQVNGSTDTVAYLGHHFATQRYVDDTARVIDGEAIFQGDERLPEGIYFYYTPTTYFEFLIGEQTIAMETSSTDILNKMNFTGSPVNQGFYQMQILTAAKRAESSALQSRYEEETDETSKAALADSLKLLNEEVLAFQIELQQKYPGSILDRMIRVMQTPKVPEIPANADKGLYQYLYFKDHFWDGIDLADPGLLRTPLLHSKITEYLDNVIVQDPDSVILAVDYILQTASNNPEAYRYTLITLANKYETSPVMGLDKVFVHIVDEYYLKGTADWVDQETLDKLRDRTASIKPNLIGNPAPPLSLWDTLGANIDVKNISARFTILYFYDPDCGHCKTKTPILYEEYPDLKAKGVEIIAICTTTNEQRWHEFIREYDLGWINLADLRSETYFKFYYDIRSTPTIYILDKEKNILVKKIDVEQISPIIDDLIARNL
jgi:peroxiredoxin